VHKMLPGQLTEWWWRIWLWVTANWNDMESDFWACAFCFVEILFIFCDCHNEYNYDDNYAQCHIMLCGVVFISCAAMASV